MIAANPLSVVTGVTSACSSATVSTPLPSSAVAAMALVMAVRLPLLTPDKPMAFNC